MYECNYDWISYISYYFYGCIWQKLQTWECH